MDTKTGETLDSLDLAWGAAAIGKEMGCNRRQTFHMLENGMIPAAKKVGGRWVVERGRLREFFLESAG